MYNNVLQNKHLLSRAGFGVKADQLYLLSLKNKDLRKKIFEASSTIPTPITIVDITNIDTGNLKDKTPEARKLRTQQFNRQTNSIALSWMSQMAYSDKQLAEKMSFFWMGHFASRVLNSNFNQDFLNTIRQNALGDFRVLLKAISQSASMLSFLNNQQNKKNHPNENFAREVMELFTMGRGNYTEKDIKEAARAFTGWGYMPSGEFIFRENQHDEGEKTFLGKTGNFDGNAVLDIICDQEATPKFICTKIYRFFVNDKISEENVAQMSREFVRNNLNINKLMQFVFSSDWFYNNENIGAKVKSPTELFIGIQRILPLNFDKPEIILTYGNLLGQVVFRPPNVAGWPSGTNWIDSSTLLLRMKIPQIWSGMIPMAYKPLEDDDLNMGKKQQLNPENGKAKIDWEKAKNLLGKENLMDLFFQKPPNFPADFMNEFNSKTFEQKVISLMSIPEYQLC